MTGAHEHVPALRSDLARFGALVDGDPSLSAPVPGLTWTAAQVVSHVSHVSHVTHVTTALSAMTATLRVDVSDFAALVTTLASDGPSAPNEVVAMANQLALDRAEFGDVTSATSDRRTAGASLLSAIESVTEPSVACSTPWHGADATRTAGTLAAVAQGELLMHGLDLARAQKQPWPIPRASAAPVAYAALTGMAPYLISDFGRAFTATFQIALRGGESFSVKFTDGAMVPGPPLPRRDVDCRISAEPEALLMTGYGRASQWPYIVRGKMAAYGRKPWLVTRFLVCLNKP